MLDSLAPQLRPRVHPAELACPLSPSPRSTTQVAANAARILGEIGREEAAFSATLSKGQKLLDEMLAKALDTAAAAAGSNGGSSSSNGSEAVLPGADAFLLYDSFGFPLELTQVWGRGALARSH